MNNKTDEYYINIAIEISKKAKYPYGAIVVKDDKIIGRSDDNTLIEKTMYSHAELMAIESACKEKHNLYGKLKGATMYVSCEPCMMCMGAILYEEFDRLVYATTLEDSNEYICKEIICDVNTLAKLVNSNMKIVNELNREAGIKVLKEYKFKEKNRILITGPILTSDSSAISTYEKLLAMIDKSYEVYSPLDTMKFMGTDEERYIRSMNLLKNTKLIISEMSNTSTGQGMEIQEAYTLGIPILVIAKTGSKISNLIKGCPSVKRIIYYDDVDEIKDKIIDFVEISGNNCSKIIND